MTKLTNLKKLVLAALNKCNVTVRQLLDMSDEERVQRRIPMEVVSFVKENLDDVSAETKTDEQIVAEDVTTEKQTVVDSNEEQPKQEEQPVVIDSTEEPVNEQKDDPSNEPELVVDGDKTRAATDDELNLIKETVAGNKAKTFTKQMTGLKAKLGEQFINELDQTQIKEIIEARITELKGE